MFNVNYDASSKPYNLSRFSVTALNGMVCSSSSLASGAGIEIMKKGGNAIDAAIATAAVLTVVEPVSNGIGGDAFCICWIKDKLYGLNASGYSPYAISIDKVKELGYEKMPKHGFIPVTVPGEPKAWAELSRRFGKLSLSECLEPAIKYAEEGYALSPTVGHLWHKYASLHKMDFKDRPEFDEWFKVFTKDGEPYEFGDIFKNQDLAKSLKLIGESYSDEFYKGEIARTIDKQSREYGGFIRYEDLKDYEVEWVEPISVNYRGYDVCEIPPNGQGIVALMALNILKNFEFKEKDSIDTYHKQFEAMKMAFADALDIVTDPKEMKKDYRPYLSDEYGKLRVSEIAEEAINRKPVNPFKGGTVYLCTADKDGNMVSYIQSNYMDFGSGVVVKDYGISLQNRGYDFSLDEKAVNCLKPHKKSYHTIIPGFLMKDGKPVGPFGVMGGYMQPQGHVQVLTNFIDFKLNPQSCLDTPRWQWIEGNRFKVEPDFDKDIIKELEQRGHIIDVAGDKYSFGRGEFITVNDNGILVGACESRCDGACAVY